jgi:hypothetical protein
MQHPVGGHYINIGEALPKIMRIDILQVQLRSFIQASKVVDFGQAQGALAVIEYPQLSHGVMLFLAAVLPVSAKLKVLMSLAGFEAV